MITGFLVGREGKSLTHDSACAEFPCCIVAPERRRGGEDLSRAVHDQEVTVRHARRSRIGAGEDVDPVVVLPQEADLHALEVGRLAEGVQDLLADGGAVLLAPVFFLLGRRFFLLRSRHRVARLKQMDRSLGVPAHVTANRDAEDTKLIHD